MNNHKAELEVPQCGSDDGIRVEYRGDEDGPLWMQPECPLGQVSSFNKSF